MLLSVANPDQTSKSHYHTNTLGVQYLCKRLGCLSSLTERSKAIYQSTMVMFFATTGTTVMSSTKPLFLIISTTISVLIVTSFYSFNTNQRLSSLQRENIFAGVTYSSSSSTTSKSHRQYDDDSFPQHSTIDSNTAVPPTTHGQMMMTEEQIAKQFQKSTLLLHPGKDGGTTIRQFTKRVWKRMIPQCHPGPCRRTYLRDEEGKGNEDDGEKATNLPVARLLTIRDPIDRFVSAFYFRAKRVEEKKSKKDKKCDDVDVAATTEECDSSSSSRTEKSRLFNRYDRNVSKLAIRLCSTNETLQNQAFEDKATIGFLMRNDLTDWLTKGWETKKDVIYPVVLEKGFDFLDHVVDAFVWAYNVRPFEPKESFERRRKTKFVHAVDQIRNETKIINSSGKEQSIPLNILGESCLRRYFEKDYQLLKQVHGVCKSQSCKQAIQSILTRRDVK